MQTTRQKNLSVYLSLLVVLLLVVLGSTTPEKQSSYPDGKYFVGSIASPQAWELLHEAARDTLEGRIALRLRTRLHARGVRSPSLQQLMAGILQRQSLLQKKLTVTLTHTDGSDFHIWDVSTQRYPLWITAVFNPSEATFILRTEQIVESLQSDIVPLVPSPEDVTLTASTDNGTIVRVAVTGTARGGEFLETGPLADRIALALESNQLAMTESLLFREARIQSELPFDVGSMKLLSTGRSNFAGSTWSRAYNVRKALSEHVNNILVPPGADFSFNSTLNGRVTLSNGWVMAKVIVRGDEMEMQPGGGICQASTTVYRAILNAGLPVKERRNHSLYVSYYKEFGVGIDATIYPGTQDLIFTNDTGNYLFIQSYTDGNDAYVHLYGTPDGRTVDLQGPYFSYNAPDSLSVNGRKIFSNEIVWLQTVTYADGSVEESQIVSRYKELPHSAKLAYRR
jgi:hypothetical protein